MYFQIPSSVLLEMIFFFALEVSLKCPTKNFDFGVITGQTQGNYGTHGVKTGHVIFMIYLMFIRLQSYTYFVISDLLIMFLL